MHCLTICSVSLLKKKDLLAIFAIYFCWLWSGFLPVPAVESIPNWLATGSGGGDSATTHHTGYSEHHWYLLYCIWSTLLDNVYTVYQTLSALLYFVNTTGHYQLYYKLSSLLGIVNSTVHCQLSWTLSTILDTVNSAGHYQLYWILSTLRDNVQSTGHCQLYWTL